MNYKGILLEYYQKQGLPPPIYDTKKVDGREDHEPLFYCVLTLRNGKEIFDSRRYYRVKDAEQSVSKSALAYLGIKINSEIVTPLFYNDIEKSCKRSPKDKSGKSECDDLIDIKKLTLKVDEPNRRPPSSISFCEKRGMYSHDLPSGGIKIYRIEPFHLFVDVENKNKVFTSFMSKLKIIGPPPDFSSVTFVISQSSPNNEKIQKDISTLKKYIEDDLGVCALNIKLFLVQGNAAFLSDASDTAITILASRIEDTDVIILTGDKFANVLCSVGNFMDNCNRFFHVTNEEDLYRMILQ